MLLLLFIVVSCKLSILQCRIVSFFVVIQSYSVTPYSLEERVPTVETYYPDSLKKCIKYSRHNLPVPVAKRSIHKSVKKWYTTQSVSNTKRNRELTIV